MTVLNTKLVVRSPLGSQGGGEGDQGDKVEISTESRGYVCIRLVTCRAREKFGEKMCKMFTHTDYYLAILSAVIFHLLTYNY